MQVNTKYERADHSCGRAIFFSPRVFVHQHRANGLVDRVYIGCSRVKVIASAAIGTISLALHLRLVLG
jgi:hypothetical protein